MLRAFVVFVGVGVDVFVFVLMLFLFCIVIVCLLCLLFGSSFCKDEHVADMAVKPKQGLGHCDTYCNAACLS